MKRLKYLSEDRKITSFTFEDELNGNVVIVVEGSNPDFYSSCAVPVEHLEQFVTQYEQVKERVRFAGLA